MAEKPREPGRRFRRFGRYALLAGIVYCIARTCAPAYHNIGGLSGLKASNVEQQMMEKSCELRANVEATMEKEMPFDPKAGELSDVIKADSIKDYQTYAGNLGESDGFKKEMDAKSLLIAIENLRWQIESQKDKDPKDAKKGGIEKYLDPKEDTEKKHEFELRKATSPETLVYNRDTSHIVPRGTLNYGDASQTQEEKMDIRKDVRAVVMLDISGSMCGRAGNFQTYNFGGQSYDIYLPSELALTIARHYIKDLQEQVMGFSFSDTSYATKFTKDMGVLASHFTKLECGNTFIDYGLLRHMLRDSNSYLDIYIITDNDILSVPEMKKNVELLREVLTDSELQRVFFIQWGVGGAVTEKQNVIINSGLRNVYFSQIDGIQGIKRLTESLDSQIGRSQ